MPDRAGEAESCVDDVIGPDDRKPKIGEAPGEWHERQGEGAKKRQRPRQQKRRMSVTTLSGTARSENKKKDHPIVMPIG